MHSFIMKVTHSLAAKDAIAVARGLYKVVEGGVATYRADNVEAKSNNSWHNKPVFVSKPQSQKEKTPSKSQVTSDLKNAKQSILNTQIPVKNSNIHNSTTFSSQKIKTINNESPKKQNQSQQINKAKVSASQSQQIKQNKQKNYKDFITQVQEIRQVNKKEKIVVESKVPSSRVSRIFQFTKLGFNIAQSAVQAYFTKNQNSSNQNATYEKIANKITDQLCKMRGAPLKLAQMLSIQEDKLIPAPIRSAFEKARETAHILPPDEVIYMMEKNFGKEWRKKFLKFEQKPFASASIGQVHLATLPNGQEVAVKIQYPGVRRSIQSDISNLGLLMKIPGVFPKGMYMDRILQNTKKQLTQQCDYVLQKQKQQAYEKCLELCVKKEFNLYKVPKVNQQFTTQEILSSQYLSGVSMKNLQESNYPQEIKDEVGRRIMLITFNELFEMGIVQSDPNPANFTYNFKKDQLNLFDFGATHIYKRKFLEDYYRIIEGSVNLNKEQIFRASIDTGFLTGQESEIMKENHIESILITGQPLRFKGKYDFGNQKITQKIYKTIPVMLKNRLKHPPEEVYSIHRKLSGSYLALMRLKARVDCNKIWQDIKFQRIIEGIKKQQNSKLVI